MQLTYFVEESTPEIQYVLDFVFRTIGIKARKVEQELPSTVDFYYGNNPRGVRYKIRVVQSKKYDDDLESDDVMWKELLVDKVRVISEGVPFDVIRAIQFFLLDLANDNVNNYDRHDRILAIDSFQYRHGILSVPIVNLYVLFLKEVIEARIGIAGVPFWPHGRVCAIGLSHDVDSPDKCCFRTNSLRKFQTISDSMKHGQVLRSIRSAAGLLRLVLKSAFTKQDFWLFDQIMNEEESYGMKSTFFFAALNKLHEAAHRGVDVSYDIAEGKFKRVFEQITKRGFEIGLHASYNAFRDPENFCREKERLESLANRKILGLRHHAWHLGPNPDTTLRYHNLAGFAYDTSIAFNDMMGFRRSVAFPYYPWSKEKKEPIRTVQIPVFLMDGNLFYEPISVAFAVKEIMQQIKIIKKSRGVGVIDWHVRTSLPMNKEFECWGEAYKEVIRNLSEDKEIWVTNLSDILKFVKSRWMKLGFS